MSEINTEIAEVTTAKSVNKKSDGKLFGQVSKFAVVGVLNTIIDLGIVNILILQFGLNPIVANVTGVSAAIINSYILNKYWTFGDKSKKNVAEQFGLFVALSLVGLLINTSVFYFLFKMWTLPGNLAFSIVGIIKLDSVFGKEFVLLNFAKAWSLAFSMIWNFIAYKKWAFKN